MENLQNRPDKANETVEDTQQTVIPDFIIESMARCLLPALYDFYESDEGKAELERRKAESERST